MEKVNLSEKFMSFNDLWDPRIAGELNGQQVKLAKLKGEFVWHSHEKEDELFLVINGKLKIEFRNKIVELNELEFIIVPKGTEHKPSAEKEVWVLLFEPSSTLNTGNTQSDFKKEKLKWI